MSAYISCPACYGVGNKTGLGYMTNTCPTCQGIKYVPKPVEPEINKVVLPSDADYPSQEKIDSLVDAITPARRGRPPKNPQSSN